MITVLALGVVQAVLVSALIAQRSKRRRAEHALHTSEAALRSSMCEAQTLAGRLIVSQELERRRIGRDLHDNLSQKLSLLSIDIDRLGVRGTGSAVVEAVAHLSARVHDIASDVHRLSHDLHPPFLESLGLVPSIDKLCRDVSSRRGVRIAFRHRTIDRHVPTDVGLGIFRITQQALQNVVNHSGAGAATVRLALTGRNIRLHIVDNGQGFDLAAKDGVGLGLLSMRERARSAGGRIAIRSAAGRGTRVVVIIPLLPASSNYLAHNLKESVRTTSHKHRQSAISRLPRTCALALVCALFGTPARALAKTDKWEVDVAPLYFWVATTDGNLAVNADQTELDHAVLKKAARSGQVEVVMEADR